ncbi:galanin receptor 2b-like isoform X2 [Ptychodera flava]|uniref:galanin receptor 2b-like isoform X2 n=1 Tax=Ptychodera flava TaxID=63121 RepID=UPI003969D4FE
MNQQIDMNTSEPYTASALENLTQHWLLTFGSNNNNDVTVPSSHFRRPGFVNQYIEMALLSLIMLLGMLGNILVFVVCLKRGNDQNSTANYFLCSLAASDLLVCTVVIPLHIHLEAVYVYRSVTDTECQLSIFFWNQSMYCTSWLLVGISVDRYYAIAYPLRPKFTKKKARVLDSRVDTENLLQFSAA